MTESARYRDALRETLRTTAAAYGFALSVATTLALLTSLHGKPRAGDVFLFAAGSLVAFAALELILVATTDDDGDSAGGQAFPFAGALNFISVGAALGCSVAIAHILSGALAWLVAPFAATFVYLAVVALQVRVVEAWRG